MSKIKVTSKCELYDGMSITFRAPCDSTAVDGLNVYHNGKPQSFSLRDTHGNTLSGLGALFEAGAYVKTILDTQNGYAYLQNADTNGYLEETFTTLRASTYTKGETLSDTTKASFGLGTNAVPEDVFAFLGEYAKYYWKRQTEDFVFSIGTATTTSVLHEGSASATRTIYFGDSVAYAGNGEIVIVNEQSAEFSYDTRETLKSTVLGKYIRNAYTKPEQIYYVPTDASSSADGTNKYYRLQLSVVSGSFEHSGDWEIVSSPDPNAYPEGSIDIEHGYYYIRMGRPFDNAVVAPKVVHGSYVGTGKAGDDSPTTLTFEFAPEIVFISAESGIKLSHDDGYNQKYAMLIKGVTSAYVQQSASNASNTQLAIKWYGTSVSMYHTYSSPYSGSQFNSSGVTYRYVAIG